MTPITKSKPFYAVAGAGDLAVKTLRQVPDRLSTLKVERKDLENAVTTIQVETKALPVKAQTLAVGVVSEVTDRADAVYGDLVGRGRRLVTRVRRQKATQDLEKQATTTVRRTKAARTTAKKGAAATRTSARSTATTARKRANATGSATKAAGTSARRTTKKAAKATGDAAAKTGR